MAKRVRIGRPSKHASVERVLIVERPPLVHLRLDGKSRYVGRDDYVRAKTKQLREFGYDSLRQDELQEQLDLLLAGKLNRLTVIGKFMEDEVVRYTPRGTEVL